jgi:hypothetical protein
MVRRSVKNQSIILQYAELGLYIFNNRYVIIYISLTQTSAFWSDELGNPVSNEHVFGSILAKPRNSFRFRTS